MTGHHGPDRGREVSRYLRVALRETGELAVAGSAPVAAHLRAGDGGVRTGALLTVLDNVGGLCGGLAALPEGWVVSTNLAARVLTRECAGPLDVDAAVLRRGRNNVVTAVTIRDAGARGATVADGVLTSAILVPEHGPPVWTRPLVLDPGPAPEREPPPIPEWLGIRAVDAATVEIDLADDLRNPWGILHGGVVAMLVDHGAEHAMGGACRDVVLHFLAPNRLGPVQARARRIGSRSDGTIARVEIRDVGGDRVTAVAVATVTPMPA